MLHWYCKMTIILRKRKNVKETIIMRRREYLLNLFYTSNTFEDYWAALLNYILLFSVDIRILISHTLFFYQSNEIKMQIKIKA